MKKSSIASVASVASVVLIALIGLSGPPAAAVPTAASAQVATASTVVTAPVAISAASDVAQVASAPSRAPAHTSPVPTVTGVVTQPVPAPVASATQTTSSSRTDYINSMYLSVVPAGERAALAGQYTLGYNLAGLDCGTGCTGLFAGQARSSFNATFFSESVAYQRNTLAHEAVHAVGFLFLTGYSTPSWAAIGGWQSEFHDLDRSFAKAYDAEAWAACVAWQETGFNNRVDQIANVCTPQAAAVAMAHLP